jgi:hypothetical protein
MYNEEKEFKKFITKQYETSKRALKLKTISKVAHHLQQSKYYAYKLRKEDGFLKKAHQFNVLAKELEARLEKLIKERNKNKAV